MINSLCITMTLLVWLAGCPSSKAIAFSYECVSSGNFTLIHILIVDPKENEIKAARAQGDSIPRETVAAISMRHNALAAINGGFWKLDGRPAGILKIDHHWYGTPLKPRGAIGWSDGGNTVIIDRVLTNFDLKDCPDENLIVIYPVSSPPCTSTEQWQSMDHVVGGTPVLISKGNLVSDYSPEQTLQSFLTNKHPRTAVGIRENGEWIFVVADGRFNGFLGGMTMKELAEFMLGLNCVEALNLDGGGSSTLVIEGEVINSPCGNLIENGKHVKAVSDAILISLRNAGVRS